MANTKIFAVCTILLALLAPPAWAEDMLLSTQQPLNLGNLTLVVEDADPQAGKVWLSICGDNEAPISAILGLGEQFHCRGLVIKVDRIYAGGGGDLVALEINGGSK